MEHSLKIVFTHCPDPNQFQPERTLPSSDFKMRNPNFALRFERIEHFLRQFYKDRKDQDILQNFRLVDVSPTNTSSTRKNIAHPKWTASDPRIKIRKD
ncbi:hypothetical protein CH380_05605 [Leptospira adleri]|uniref:Uncharacterized protein n=1 Tax=Leptospira adleri TaxID=2023186 RepID=A0A2M9YR58_9LEPT|nr:hypothetical protein CH380_05605 [Leptospira adleri]PJZ63323.1 hypothetical protein CH376_03530 [Leptospira adleri]